MSDDGVMVPNVMRKDDDYGVASHVERINPGDNPAWAADAAGAFPIPEEPSGVVRAYRLLTKAFHNGALLLAGDIVRLREDEVGPHHELIPEPEPDEPPSGKRGKRKQAEPDPDPKLAKDER